MTSSAAIDENLYLQNGHKRRPIVVLGEVLWDVFAGSRRLGGAALNFAAHAKRLARPGTKAPVFARLDKDGNLHAALFPDRPCWTNRSSTSTTRARGWCPRDCNSPLWPRARVPSSLSLPALDGRLAAEHLPSDLAQRWLRSKGNSIEGGTSEIMLDIVAKRVLELPSE